MNRIKYPSRKEIHRQASVIVDRADIFEDFDEALDFTECRPVRKSRRSIKKVSYCCVAVSGLFVLLLLSREIISAPRHANNSALSRVTVDDTVQPEAAVTVNEKVTVQYNQKVVYANVRFGDGDEMELVRLECKIPTVYVDGESVQTISDYYEEQIEELSREQVILYEEEENKTAKNISLTEKKSTDAFETGVRLKYEVSVVSNSNNVTSSSDIISFVENYSASSQGISEDFKESRVYGSNFNVNTGKLLTLADLFTDYKKGSEELMNAVFSQILRRHANDVIENDYNSVQGLLESLDESRGWYLGQEGITVCCNRIRTEDVRYFESNREFIKITSNESYVVPYSQLTYLKK